MNPTFTAYIQHGTGTPGPYLTEKAPARYRPVSDPDTKRGRIRTHWELKTAGRWRRLNLTQGEKGNYAYVCIDRRRVPVQLV